MKRVFLYIILFIWMSIIFSFSNQKSDESSNLSNRVVEHIITIVEKLNNTKIDDVMRKNIYDYAVYPIRKLAHVTIYFILGIIVCNLVLTYNINFKKLLLISIMICFAYATTDEIHQLFVSGRSGSPFDVLIDTCGSILGILLSNKLFNRKTCK